MGRGGLGEAAGVEAGIQILDGGAAGRAEGAAVSTAEVVRQPSEAEQALKLMAGQLRGLKKLSLSQGERCGSAACKL